MLQKQMVNGAGAVLFRRLPYMLSPQLDIYERLDWIVENKSVLEVGFGTGLGVMQYVKHANFVQAIEIDPAAVKFAKRCFPLKDVSWQLGDVTDWDAGGLKYDVIVMVEVLEHVFDYKKALGNVRGFLRPGGQALITVPNNRRYRKKEESLNEQEWDPAGFKSDLMDYFDKVQLLNFNLDPLMDVNTRETPVVALCS